MKLTTLFYAKRHPLLRVAALAMLSSQVMPNIALAQAPPPRPFRVFWERSNPLPALRSTSRRLQAWSMLRSSNRLQRTSRYRPI
jgi:hypothetical protein